MGQAESSLLAPRKSSTTPLVSETEPEVIVFDAKILFPAAPDKTSVETEKNDNKTLVEAEKIVTKGDGKDKHADEFGEEKITNKEKSEEKPESKSIEKRIWKHDALKLAATNLTPEERISLHAETRKWAAAINHATITPLENYFKVFALPPLGSIGASASASTVGFSCNPVSLIDYPKIVLENVKCSIIKPLEGKTQNINKCKIRIYLDSTSEPEFLILQCVHEIELRISALCGVPANIIVAAKKKHDSVAHTHTLTFLFPAVASMSSVSMSDRHGKICTLPTSGIVFTSTICATLIRCDWISKAVLPRFVLTSAF